MAADFVTTYDSFWESALSSDVSYFESTSTEIVQCTLDEDQALIPWQVMGCCVGLYFIGMTISVTWGLRYRNQQIAKIENYKQRSHSFAVPQTSQTSITQAGDVTMTVMTKETEIPITEALSREDRKSGCSSLWPSRERVKTTGAIIWGIMAVYCSPALHLSDTITDIATIVEFGLVQDQFTPEQCGYVLHLKMSFCVCFEDAF